MKVPDPACPPTPEGLLIQRTRQVAIPKLTIRAAAARIGMSPEQWGYVERGYYPARGGNPHRPCRARAAVLAKMAHVVAVSPGRLTAEGRPDAAGLLEVLLDHRSERDLMNEPKRREQRRTHLDASAVPVERALLARAHDIEAGADSVLAAAGDAQTAETLAARIRLSIAAEFRDLAEELHFW